MKLDFNFNGKTMLKNWWQQVKANFQTVQNEHNTLSNNLDSEIINRTNADTGLANKIEGETKARESAVNLLNISISNETIQRHNADNALQDNIDTEVTSREVADDALQSNIDTETKNRQAADKELQTRIDTEIKNIQVADNKADKTDLYGTDETTTHTVTYSLTAADLVIDINSAYSTGTVTISGDTVKNKILLDGHSIHAAELSAKFNCGKGDDERGERFVNIHYSPTTNALNMEIVDVDDTSPEEGTVAMMTVDYNTATVSSMINRSQTYSSVNNLTALKTTDKNSFLSAVNEIVDQMSTEIDSRKNADSNITQQLTKEIAARTTADEKMNNQIAEITKTITDITKNQIFVQCDGDHDELKIQAAINNAPSYSVIYPVGECVITNDNTVSSMGELASAYSSVIRLKTGMVLDGTYCESITFKNTNPTEKQYIFQLLPNSEMRNVEFYEDTETVTETSINPTVIYASSSNIKIKSCNFSDIFDTNQVGTTAFNLGNNVLFLNNTIDSFVCQSKSGTTYGIKAGRYAKITGNTFSNFTQPESSVGCVLQTGSNTVFQGNTIQSFTNCNVELNGEVCGNRFEKITDCKIKLGGEVVGNAFVTINQNKSEAITINSKTNFVGNKLTAIKMLSDTIDLIYCETNSIISDNYFGVTKVSESGVSSLLYASSHQPILSGNIFNIDSSYTANEQFDVIYCEDGAMVKNNITNTKTLGTFTDSCTVEGNVTGGDA